MPKEERREQLLDAAVQVIVADGWAALSMERVAREADIAKTVVYSAFDTQAGLMDALMSRAHERAFALSAAAVPSLPITGDPLQAIQDSLMTWLEGIAADPETWRLVLMPSDGTPPSVRAVIDEGREHWRRELEPIAALILQGLAVDSLDIELIAHLSRGNAEYLARLMLEQPERFTPERLTSFITKLAAESLRLTS